MIFFENTSVDKSIDRAIESDLSELKKYAKGKLYEFLNQLFINNDSAKELLNGLRIDNAKTLEKLEELSKINPERTSPLIKKAGIIDDYILRIENLLNNDIYNDLNKKAIIKLCVSLEMEINYLNNSISKINNTSLLGKIRVKSGFLKNIMKIVGLSTALSSAEVMAPENNAAKTNEKIIMAEHAISKPSFTAYNIIEDAKKELGKKYSFGQKASNSWDCSSLVRYVFSKNGIALEGDSRTLSNYGEEVIKKKLDISKLKQGDLLFFTLKTSRPRGHVGIYVGDGKMLHAGVSTGVAIVSLDNNYWQRSFVSAKRVIN